MTVFRIPCPSCCTDLKIKDRALIGRKVKCPGCGHQFVLTDPDEDSGLGTAETAVFHTADLQPPPADPPPTREEPTGAFPAIDTTSEGGVEKLKELRRRNRKRRSGSWIAALIFLALAGGAFSLLRPDLAQDQPEIAAEDAANQPAGSVEQAADDPPPTDTWTDAPASAQEEPIALHMVPSGVRLIINLRPRRLWSDEPRMAELRASLTQDVTGWLENSLRTVCRHEPAQIEEVMFAWILGARGTEPQLTAVVHLVDDARMSQLLDEFGHEALDELAQPKVYVKDDHATLILDTKTFAIAPREFGDELPDWVETPNLNTSDGILNLLPHTDRQRLVTVLFEPADVPRHLELLVSEPARPVIASVADWFATEAQAETVAWSLDTGEAFHSELLVLGPRTSSPSTMLERVTERIEAVPHTMVDLVRRMQPQRSGFRKLIGRFPAMLEVSRMATRTGFAGRAAQLTTIMPPKAAPNLALGTVLTWDESTRTDFSAEPPTMAAATPALPDTVVERLQLPVDAEFNNVPLQDALDYIAGEIHVSVEIDGDALKDAGFTKNMAQSYNLGKVPAAEALAHLIGQYKEPGKEMVLVIDEPRQTLLILTRKFADRQGLSVHDFGT